MRRLSTHLFELRERPGRKAPVAIQFPFAGGSVHALREYGDLLPAYRHLAVHYPGRGWRMRDGPAESIFSIADAVASEYLELAKDSGAEGRTGPLLIGHSLGGYVALESAVRLEAAGIRCAGLVFSSSLPPGTVVRDDTPLRVLAGGDELDALSDEALARALVAGGAMPKEITTEPELLAMVLPILRHDCCLGARYRATGPSGRLSCPTFAFGALDDPAVPPESLDDWCRFTDGAFSVRVWPGDHFWFRSAHSGVGEAVESGLRSG